MKADIRPGMIVHTIEPMLKQNGSFEYKQIQPMDRFLVLEVEDSLFIENRKTIEAANERIGTFVFDEDEVVPCERKMRKPY